MTLAKRICSFDRKALEARLRSSGYEEWDTPLVPIDWRCNRNALQTGERCIFHSEGQDSAELEAAIQNEITSSELSRLNFTGAIFPKTGIDLTNVPTSKPAVFIGADFKGPTFFLATMFSHIVNFEKANFASEVSFKDAVFKRSPRFAGARFTDASFRGAVFEEAVEFNFAKIVLGNFFETTFKKDASFQGAELLDTSFHASNFESGVDFNLCKITNCDFGDVVVRGQSRFDEARLKDVSFEAATFVRPVSFEDCVFSGSTKFTNAVFLSEASLCDARTDALGSVWFVGDPDSSIAEIVEQDENTGAGLDEQLRAELAKHREIASRGRISLRLVRLIGADIRHMHFLNVDWNRKAYGIGPFTRTRSSIYDELRHEGSDIPGDYESVAATYRQLRRNYEIELRYHEAGDFYVGEMEMRRLQLSCQSRRGAWRWLRRNILSILGCYRNISFFGESYILAGLWIVGMILLFAVMRGATVASVCDSVTSKCTSTMDLNFNVNLLSQSFLAFFQLKSDSDLDLVERLVGAFLTAMLFIPLKRHFERR
jgi:uncharacterized protein YjbI with pentapeptide repeats